MYTAKLTSKYQTTIPSSVREKLGLHSGDRISFEIDNDTVVLKKLPRADYEYLKSLEDNLSSEWSSEEDNEAYDTL